MRPEPNSVWMRELLRAGAVEAEIHRGVRHELGEQEEVGRAAARQRGDHVERVFVMHPHGGADGAEHVCAARSRCASLRPAGA